MLGVHRGSAASMVALAVVVAGPARAQRAAGDSDVATIRAYEQISADAFAPYTPAPATKRNAS